MTTSHNRLARHGALVALLSAVLLTGCGSAPIREAEEIPPEHPVSAVVREGVTYPIDVYDPWEGFNRSVYKFNAKFDQFVFLPTVNFYETITPDFLEQGISNFFSNLSEIRNFANSLFQLKPQSAATAVGRFAINSSLGIFGLWDVATFIEIPQRDEDFGQTLGHYGVGNGPYMVLPIFGPSNARDTTGLVVDTAINGLVYDALDPLDNTSNEGAIRAGVTLLKAIDTRHRLGFRYYQTGSPFEYDLVRMLYNEKRQIEIGK